MKNDQILSGEHMVCDKVEKCLIETALQKNWTIPHRRIIVAVLSGNVTLSGTVDTKHAYHEAGKAALQTPGVISVSNNIVVIKATTPRHAE